MRLRLTVTTMDGVKEEIILQASHAIEISLKLVAEEDSKAEVRGIGPNDGEPG